MLSLSNTLSSVQPDYIGCKSPIAHSAPTAVNSTEINLPPLNPLSSLISELRVLLNGKGLSAEDIDVDHVVELMQKYTSNEADWSHYALHDPTLPYSRNGIVNINGNANLLILVWAPGKSSAIHDHANAHCVMKILKGSLKEHLYDIPHGETKMKEKKTTLLERDVVGYISDDIGLHKISNPTDELAVSLHLYTPPYAANFGCNRYDDQGHKFHVDMSKYYSWQGEIVTQSGASNC
jgi:cysteine dioxygenase